MSKEIIQVIPPPPTVPEWIMNYQTDKWYCTPPQMTKESLLNSEKLEFVTSSNFEDADKACGMKSSCKDIDCTPVPKELIDNFFTPPAILQYKGSDWTCLDSSKLGEGGRANSDQIKSLGTIKLSSSGSFADAKKTCLNKYKGCVVGKNKTGMITPKCMVIPTPLINTSAFTGNNKFDPKTQRAWKCITKKGTVSHTVNISKGNTVKIATLACNSNLFSECNNECRAVQ